MNYWTIFWVHTIVLVAKGALGQSEGDVRLVDGSSPLEGRIEVYYNGEWGTICSLNQDWDITDGDVVCRQLGFQVSLGSPSFGLGMSTQPIWLTNVQCEASDQRIDECITNNQWGQTNTCAHANDVGVRCSVTGKIIDGPNDDRVKLNETARLNCTVFSSEELTHAWERNGVRLSTVNRTTVNLETGLETSGGTYFSIILELSGIVRSDNGIYECIVMDQAGNETDRGNFAITVIEIPELSNPRYDYNDDATQLTILWDEFDVNTVTLSCTAFYYVTESNDTQEMTFPNPNKEAVITGLKPFTTYSVSLICQNEVGLSERLVYANETTFQGAPEAPTNVDVSEIEQTTALVTWQPLVAINGELVGYTVLAQPQDCRGPCRFFLEDVPAAAREWALTDLSPGVNYLATVQAFNREDRLTGPIKRRSSDHGTKTFTTAPAYFRECDSVPCQNNATCYEDTNYYNCICAPGFIGTYCENMCPAGTFGDYCMDSCTCVEGANCSNVDGNCTCDPAFDGAACDKNDLTVSANRTSPDDISEGDIFTLTCQVNLAEVDLQEVAWYRNTVKLPSMSDQDYLVMNDPGMGEYNITILSAGAEDTGSFICTAVAQGNQNPRSSDPINISVLVTGKIIDGPNDDRVKLNETSMLNCTAFSSEKLTTLAFERNGTQLSNDSRTTVTKDTGLETLGGTYYSIILELSGIMRSDNGIYECIVMDQAGNETDRGDFTITVIEIPELSNPRYNYNSDARQFTIAWDEFDVNAVTTNCTAFYNATGSNETEEMTFTNPNKEATIEGLTPFTTYSVSLICQNEVGPSEQLVYADEKTFQGAPDPPTNVDVSLIEQTTALVTWERPLVINGELVGYTVLAQPQDCKDLCRIFLKDALVSDRQWRLTDLSPGVDYLATVRAYNLEDRLQEDFGRRSSDPGTKTFTTAPALPGPPNNVRSTDTPDVCTIQWEEPLAPNGVIVSYRVTMNIYRLGDDTVIETVDRAGLSSDRRSYEFLKNDLPDYSDFSFTVAATNDAGRGTESASVACQKQQVGEPLVPEMLPAPSTTSHNSFTTTIPTFNDRNGPVSCYEVVVVQLQNASAAVNSSEPTFSPGQVKQYEDRAKGVPYITQVMSSIPEGNEIAIGSPNSETTTCNTGHSARRKRASTPASELTGVNGPLNPSGIYTSFVRVYSPNDDEVLFRNGPFMQPVILNKQPPNVAGIVGGIFGFLIVVCLILVVMLIFYRLRREEDKGVPTILAGVGSTNNYLQNKPKTSPGSPQESYEYEMV